MSLYGKKEEVFVFLVEWHDVQSSLVRQYQLSYFVVDDTIEMYDIKNRRTFLKRCSYPSIKLEDLYVDSTVTIYARQLKVVDFGDEFTRSRLAQSKSRTVAVVKPSAITRLGRVVDAIFRTNFIISKMKMLRLTPKQAQEFYGENGPSARSQDLSSGPVVAMEIVGPGVQDAFAMNAGDPSMKDVAVSTSKRNADSESRFLFENPDLDTSAQFDNCTLCLIKPHAVLAGAAGSIIERLETEGFEISALQMFNLDRQAADEFFEVYKTVVPYYNAMVEHLQQGPCIAVEVRGEGVVQKLRGLCGPSDPEIARHLRPKSLRAMYGQNQVKNAVHCTDLAEDGPLESEFFFNILQKSVHLKH